MSLLEFYGTECPHCIRMAPLVEKLKTEGFEVEQFETWHNIDNADKLAGIDHGLCGGVPFFYNTETKKHICGGTTYERLKEWAEGK